MKIRAYQAKDFQKYVQMRVKLWPEILENGEDPEADAKEWLARRNTCVLVVESAVGTRLKGFAEVSERAYADGCSTSPVAYLEGWYVEDEARRQGIGRALVEAAETWARELGYSEFASDALLENHVSQRAHKSAGFVEVERAVRYRKSLTSVEANIEKEESSS